MCSWTNDTEGKFRDRADVNRDRAQPLIESIKGEGRAIKRALHNRIVQLRSGDCRLDNLSNKLPAKLRN